MEGNYKNLIKNMGYLTISNFTSKILVFLLIPLYTNCLTPEEYGTYDAIVVLAQFLAPLLIANVSEGVMRYMLDNKYNKMEVSVIGSRYLLFGLFLAFILCILNLKYQVIHFLNGYEIFAFFYLIFYIINSYYTQYAKGINKLSLMAIAGVLGTFVSLFSNVLCLTIFDLGIKGFFIANILGLAIPSLYYTFMFSDWKKQIGVKYNRELSKEMLNYSLPLVFNSIGWTINSSLDKYCVIYMIGLSTSGLLAISYKIPTILSVVYSFFTQAWQVSAVTVYESEARKEFYSETFLYINAIGSLLCSILLLCNKLLATILFANEFFNAWRFVPFLLISVLFNQMAGFIGPLLSAKKNSNAMAKAAFVGAIVNLVFNLVLIKLFNAQGAVIATAISSVSIYYVRWKYAKDLLNNNIYTTLYLTWCILIIGAFVEVCGVNSLLQLATVISVGFINKKQLVKIINSVLNKIKKPR